MRKQTVMWTALPGGIKQGSRGDMLRLSVLVSPRLQTDEGLPRPELSQFPDFVDWPAADLEFGVKFDSGPTVAAGVVSESPESAMWAALFKPTTYVRPYEFPPLAGRLVRSFPAMFVAQWLQSRYSSVATSYPDSFPLVEALGGKLGFNQISGYGQRSPNGVPGGAELEQQLDAQLQKLGAVPPALSPNPRLDFYQAHKFYQPRNLTRVGAALPDLDFHQIVSMLGDYPVLMRKLGLVFDLEIPADAAIPAAGTVRLVVKLHSPNATEHLFPKTAYLLDSDFQPASRPAAPEIKDRLLDLAERASFQVLQMDLDSSAEKAMQLADHLLRQMKYGVGVSGALNAPLKGGAAAGAALPALRSGGLSVVRTGRALQVAQALDTASQRNADIGAGNPVTLYAEDLTRGYRVDVWDDKTGNYHSLCRRIGTYHFLDGDITLTAADEGIVTMGATSASDGSSDDLYLHESLFRWTGWSLVAPRPGRIIDTGDGVAAGDPAADSAAGPDFRLETRFRAAPGSLPRLRFGTTYRVRARTVDLAGNSLSLEEAAHRPEAAGATEPAPYSRLEPVLSPTLVPRAKAGSGESLERLVIRSNYDTDCAEAGERHVAPPKVAQLTAEEHGMFDVAGGLDRSAYGTIVARDATFAEVEPAETLTLPYLPDPAAAGAALKGLPGLPDGAVQKLPFRGPWPEVAPVRIRIVEGSGAPDWDDDQNLLTIYLRKAEIAPVRLSTYLNLAQLRRMAIWEWIEKAGLPDSRLQQLKQAALLGQHWMISPNREIVLVHAIQQPLAAPEFQKLHARRNQGETFATLEDTAKVHCRSTARLDVTAEWSEPVDILSEPAPRTATGSAQPFHLDLAYTDTAAEIQHRHEFGDTKYRKVNYSATATTRFAEYFQTEAAEYVVLSGTAPSALAHTPVVDHTETVTDDFNATYTRDVDYTIDYGAGTLIRLTGGGIADGTNVRVAYSHYPGPITRETAAPVSVDVLSSARPAAPKVLYVVPTFGWERKQFDGGEIIKRSGGGLRVYLERPWYSSGDGELLGVLCWPGLKYFNLLSGSRPPDAMKPYVSQWGLDPIWSSQAPDGLPKPEHFTHAVATGLGLSLEETAGTVNVAGHAVQYDPDRRLWYCDIEMESGHSYYPFVRLALARYQPGSILGAHLSRVVLADYAQLAPDRLATILTDEAHPTRLEVNVCGPGYDASGAGHIPSEMEVTVEEQRSEVTGELRWVPVAGPAFPLTVRDMTGPDITWTGPVTLPQSRGSKPFRLMIKEYERFQTDSVQSGMVPMSYIPTVPTARRLVYAAVLEV